MKKYIRLLAFLGLAVIILSGMGVVTNNPIWGAAYFLGAAMAAAIFINVLNKNK